MDVMAKGNSVIQTMPESDNELIQYRVTFRAAVEAKHLHGWKLSAVVAHMKTRGFPGMTEQYVYKLYDGTRPITDKIVVALPDPVNAVFDVLRTEQRDGQIVIKPTIGREGARQFASGLYGFMQQLAKLPATAGAPIKADLRPSKAKPRTAAGGHR